MILSNKGKKFNKIGHSLNLLHYQYDALRGGGGSLCWRHAWRAPWVGRRVRFQSRLESRFDPLRWTSSNGFTEKWINQVEKDGKMFTVTKGSNPAVDSEWQDLVKFRHFGKILKVFGNFLRDLAKFRSYFGNSLRPLDIFKTSINAHILEK